MDPVEHVWIIDDDDGLRVSLGMILEDAGYAVQEFARGRDALACLAGGAPLVAVVDIRLPDMNGEDLLRSLKTADPTTAVVIISGHATTENAVAALNAGAEAYLLKPFHPDEAKTVIARAVEKRRLVEENARLYRETQDRARYLATLNEIGQAITSTLDLDRVLITLLESVRQTCNAEACSVALIDKNAGGVVFRQAVGGASQAVIGLRLKLGQGFAGWVAAHRQPALSPDAAADPRFYGDIDNDEGFRTRDLVCVPLSVRDTVIGVVELLNKREGTFDANDVQLLESVAAQAAIAIENARLFEETHRRLDEMAVVSEVALAGAAGLLFDETVARATQALARLWSGAKVEFLFVDENHLTWYSPPFHQSAQKGSVADQPLSLGQGITGRAMRERQPVRAGNVATDPRCVNYAQGVQSEMAAPLVVGERVIGVVKVASPHLNTFSEDDLRLLGTLAGQLVTIFEKARLDVSLSRYAEFLEQRVNERTTELKAANEELSRAARLKDEFLANMSHELRTPLNAVLGMSEALQEQVYGPLNEKQLKSLHTIEMSGQHLLSLINDILDLSKIEAGKLELRVGPVAVEMICQASLRFVNQAAHAKQLQISLSFDSQVLVIQADERCLKQILVNLLGNAVKFTPQGGAIGLEVKGDADQQVVHLTVWDTGIGIAKEDVEQLFKPFTQLDSRLSRQYSGTGLGLSLVHRMVELHGGSISVESKVGRGSRFTVSLPWREPEVEKKPLAEQEVEEMAIADLPSPSSSASRLGKVLLVEDNEDNINTLTQYLKAVGYAVQVARDGSKVIPLVGQVRPDVVLMDIQMPGIDGLKAIHRIRASTEPGVAAIPIIALTALTMPGDRERCLKAGANEYLSKPVGLKKLVELIKATSAAQPKSQAGDDYATDSQERVG